VNIFAAALTGKNSLWFYFKGFIFHQLFSMIEYNLDNNMFVGNQIEQ